MFLVKKKKCKLYCPIVFDTRYLNSLAVCIFNVLYCFLMYRHVKLVHFLIPMGKIAAKRGCLQLANVIYLCSFFNLIDFCCQYY